MAFYGLRQARQGLIYFAAGKLVSALLGVAFLLLMVRALDAAAYGAYIAILAVAELFYLVSGLGLSTVAQRYVAEYRLRVPATEFTSFLRRQLVRRLVHSCIGLVLILPLWTWFTSWTGLDLVHDKAALLALLLAAWASSSFLDEVLAACLLQGLAQLLATLRSLARVGTVLVLSAMGSLDLYNLLWAEASIATLSAAAGSARLLTWAHRSPSAPGATNGYQPVGMAGVCWRFYLVQLVGQAYGVNAVKILLTRLQGLAHTATFGFAQSLADMARNYLPAQLLAGWIRPLMVARYVVTKDVDQLCLVANMAFKANLLGLLPLLAIFSTPLGDQLLAIATAGRYDQAGAVLAILVLGLILQSAHLMLTMITLTIEAPGANLRATVLAACTLPAVVWLIQLHGAIGAAWSAVLTEVVWVGSVVWLLRRQGHRLWMDVRGTLVLCLAGAVAYAVGVAAGSWHWPLLLSLAALAAAFLGTLALLRPATSDEMQLLSRFFRRDVPPV